MIKENSYIKNDFDKFLHYICIGNLDKVKSNFLSDYLEMNNKAFMKPIHLASRYGHLEIVKFLHQNHSNIETSTKMGWRAIHFACRFGHFPIVLFLFNCKCNIEACTKEDWRPIHLASQEGHIEIVKFLHQHRCIMETCDKGGHRPIHLACEKGRIEVVKYLSRDCKCNLDVLTKSNFLPIDLARQKKYWKTVDLINEEKRLRNFLLKDRRMSSLMRVNCDPDCDHTFCVQLVTSRDFQTNNVIGCGCFGEVYKLKDSLSDLVLTVKSVKLIDKTKDFENLKQSINKYHDLLKHERIAKYFGSVFVQDMAFIFVEFIAGGSLSDHIAQHGSIQHNKINQYNQQILQAVQFLHQNKIIHRDIKPKNILLVDGGNIKLCDFGLSRELESIARNYNICDNQNKGIQPSIFSGTPNYMAPEVYNEGIYSFSSDIWSVGASIVEMLTGKPPYAELIPNAIIYRITSTKRITFQPCEPMSNNMKSFMKLILDPVPTNRATAEMLLKYLIDK